MAKLCLCQFMFLLIIALFCIGNGSTTSTFVEDGLNEQACEGTNLGLTKTGDSESRYIKYKRLYTNCTYLVGNLEIAFLETPGKLYDLSFLSNIREITGYVLIVGNLINYIPLTSLRIVRGETLFSLKNSTFSYSMFIALNYDKHGGSNVGLKELRFTNLTEILHGRVYFQDNQQLCFENSIDWEDINTGSIPPVKFKDSGRARTCPECHESCLNPSNGRRNCWGEGPGMCQKLSHVVCHENCGNGRCYGLQPNECCHPQCAGGCTGPRKTQCFACRNLLDDGACVSQCPRDIIYDPALMMKVKNPNAKYAFGSMCVKKCPSYMLQDDGFCVRSCSEGKHAADGQNCRDCNGPCPRTCKGPIDQLDASNIHEFENCTTIDGSLTILFNTFEGDPHYNIPPLHPSNLTILKNVREITEYLLIQSKHPDFTDLSFLSNLETIHGRVLSDPVGTALNIGATHLRSLELTSLKNITHGNVLLLDNIYLCYADTIDWQKIFSHSKQKSNIISNRPRDECEFEGEVCDPQCGSSGCWGKGPNKCLSCANYVYEEQSLCLNKCSDVSHLYHKSGGKCHRCHPECANTCSGPNNTDCDKCANVIMRNKDKVDVCEPECPNSMYPDENSVCQTCHPFCGDHGCTGPNKFVGPNGCKMCDVGIRVEKDGQILCLDPDTLECDRGYFMSYFNPDEGFRRVCELCHELCTTCSSSNTEFCSECRYMKSGKHCVSSCPNLFFTNKETKSCEECHSECRGGCDGPSTHNCSACANFKIYPTFDNKTSFNCTSECPSHLPYRVRDGDGDDENRVVCADSSHPDVQALKEKDASDERRKLIIILGCLIPVALIAMVMILCCGYFAYKRARNNKKAAEYTAKITGHEEIEPLTPTSAKPDLAKMLIINESELRRGAIIGSGAFGTVYKGVWMPQGENVKIPVAIKVLQEGNSPAQSTELLNEARVMCSVEHMCCVRILAVCMSSQMMLITQLMPHGCLLEYVRENKAHIGSKVLLDWCTQIARGMSYLEERCIVHRDLAARNVLVQTPNQVKITDFGLAKLLDYESDEYHASGGLMPIKWLALECIQHRIFTHKSDVWSYGVTMWELFTYGKKPYDGIRTRDVPMMLEKGERLQQPIICTIDVYMIMVKCWMLESDSRPSFKELAEEFAKMSRDPGRYLVIKGDEFRKFPESCFSGSELELVPMDGVPMTLGAGAAGEGDTLMRLPSVSYDKEELIRGLSECPGDLVEADDYLQPSERPPASPNASQLRVFDRQHSNSPTTPLGPIIEDFITGQNGMMKSPHKGQKVREKKYAHLNAAARAKQERQQPRSRGDSVNSRYSSDPIMLAKDRGDLDWPAHSPMNSSMGDLPKANRPMLCHSLSSDIPMPPAIKTPSVSLPVDEDNYLQPKMVPAAYVDLNNKGYYQNEKAFGSTQAEPIVLENRPSSRTGSDRSRKSSTRSRVDSTSDQMSPLRPSNSSLQQLPILSHAIANPEYFDGRDIDYDEDDDVWEPKTTTWNGYQPVPNGPASPIHSSKNKDYPYYNDIEKDMVPVSPNAIPMRVLHPSESMV